MSECVQMMNENRIGSILVVSDQGQPDLIGIFTERDLLIKFEAIVSQRLWEGSIREVMTSPVKTVDISQMDQIADFMLTHNFRHVPVTVSEGGQGRQILAGVVSMRDLFKVFVKDQAGSSSWLSRSSHREGMQPSPPRGAVSIFSKDPNFSLFLKKMFNDFALGNASLIDFSKMATLSAEILILDLDGLEVAIWSQYLKKLNQDEAVKSVVIVFDPSRQSPGIGGVLEKIGQSEKFSIFRKPIDIFSFFDRMNSLSLGKSQP